MKKNILTLVILLVLVVIGWLLYQNGSLPAFNSSPVEEKPVAAKCYVGGCSGQICSDQEGLVSTCEFKPEYSCYQQSKCERQSNGQCGWTPTAGLQACLANPPTSR
jgi:hypothetical protein